jgi:hypothetical protein
MRRQVLMMPPQGPVLAVSDAATSGSYAHSSQSHHVITRDNLKLVPTAILMQALTSIEAPRDAYRTDANIEKYILEYFKTARDKTIVNKVKK